MARKLTILTRLLSPPSPSSNPNPSPSQPAPLLPDGYASVPTLSLIPPSLALSSVPTGDAFLDALKAHDAHFGALRAEAAAYQGGAVLRYVGVIDVNPENGGVSTKANLERCAPLSPQTPRHP